MSRLRSNNLADVIHGIVVGLVSDNADPEGLYRVQVTYAVPGGDILSQWARVVTTMAGPGRGFACLPEVDDEVLLRFVHGHSDLPMVVGFVHNGVDKPPFDNADGNNDERIFYSRNGHHLIANDADGAEHVTVETVDGKTKLEMKSADSLIAWEAASDVKLLCANGTLTVTADADISMDASGGWTQAAGSNVELKCDGSAKLEGGSGVTLAAPKVDVKA